MASSLKKMPTTPVLRLISPLRLSSGLVLCSLVRFSAGDGNPGEMKPSSRTPGGNPATYSPHASTKKKAVPSVAIGGRPAPSCRGSDEGRACAAVRIAGDVREGLSARDTGDAVRRPCAGIRLLRGRADARHLRQHEDRRDERVHRQGTGFQPAFSGHANHYMVEPTACSPAAGWEKGQVENQVQTARGRFLQPRLRFANLEELNGWLEAECRRWADLHQHPEQKELRLPRHGLPSAVCSSRSPRPSTGSTRASMR
jgi:hypothetical protein